MKATKLIKTKGMPKIELKSIKMKKIMGDISILVDKIELFAKTQIESRK